MRYREVAAQGNLSPFVLCYWELVEPSGGATTVEHNVFPDGCVALLYRRIPAQAYVSLRIAGPTLISRKVIVWPGDTFWGVRLQPAACKTLIGCAPGPLRDQALELAEVNPHLHHQLLPRLSLCASFEEAIDVYAGSFCSLEVEHCKIDEEIARAAHAIARSGGTAKVSEIARAVSLSTRQFERRFQCAVGLTPKQFARARRMRATAFAVARGQRINWAELAVDGGFTDQPHLAHEVRTLTGRSPAQFETDVRKIKHGDLLE